MKKKNFKSQHVKENKAEVSNELRLIKSDISTPEKTTIKFGESTVSLTYFDFAEFYGQGFNQLVFSFQTLIEEMVDSSIKTNGQTRSMTTIVTYTTAFGNFFAFCKQWVSINNLNLTIHSIDDNFIKKYIHFLANLGLGVTTQKNHYTWIKSVLVYALKKSNLPFKIFPANPYPRNNQKKKGEQPLSKKERAELIRALSAELSEISKGKDELTSYELSICAFTIAARTGLNTTPLLELAVDCLQPHPLKEELSILVSYKRRGHNTFIQSLQKSENLEGIMTVKTTQVSKIIELVLERNATIRNKSKYPNLLFIGSSRRHGNYGEDLPLTTRLLNVSATKLVEKHNLKADSGAPLSVTVMSLRKTFANRVWELSNQDPVVSSSLLGHGIKVHNDYYLQAPKESQKDWKLMGEVLVDSLLKTNAENTPVAKCSDNILGHRAPKNGTHCTNFLGCFMCKSFVVTGDDLYRLYSLYWLLVRERQNIGPRNWKKHYSHIIRVIDRDIEPKFNQSLLQEQKNKAKDNPHPFWKDASTLELANG